MCVCVRSLSVPLDLRCTSSDGFKYPIGIGYACICRGVLPERAAEIHLLGVT